MIKIIFFVFALYLTCLYWLIVFASCAADTSTEDAYRIIRESEAKYRSDSILIDRQMKIKIEEYKAK